MNAIILGAPIRVYQEEQYPWLKAEKAFVSMALQEGKRILGICFGAQMLAEMLSSRIYPNKEKQIGWHPIARTKERHPWLIGLPEQFVSFQWYGDTFDLPSGSLQLATSDACVVRSFWSSWSTLHFIDTEKIRRL